MQHIAIKEFGGPGQLQMETTADPLHRPGQVLADVEAVGINSGWLRRDHATAYLLGRAADTHRDIAERHAQGKLYLQP